jgi:predicted AAA+ superfamily ATPase
LMMDYLPRVMDQELKSSLAGLPAVAVEGAKGVGKSATAERIAGTTLQLDRPDQLANLQADRSRIDRLTPPVLIDEWQRDPPIWDAVRRSVDADRSSGRFVLTGSANPRYARLHSGAGRIVRLRMRPMSFAERRLTPPAVSLRVLLDGDHTSLDAPSGVTLDDYVSEILASGFPGIRSGPDRMRGAELDSYLDYAITREVPALGAVIRRPTALREWLRAYASATCGTTSLEVIADAVPKTMRPARSTIADYREALTQLWLLDEVPAWTPGPITISRLGRAPKHHLADPALAARLLRVTRSSLLNATNQGQTPQPRHRQTAHNKPQPAVRRSLATPSTQSLYRGGDPGVWTCEVPAVAPQTERMRCSRTVLTDCCRRSS